MRNHVQPTGLLALLIVLLISGAAAAQNSNETERLEQERQAAHLLSNQFVIMMNSALAGQGSPRPDQLLRASILLDHALDMQDGDAELWRLRSELARFMEEDEVRRGAMRRYLSLRPDDDAAQFATLIEGLSGLQTIDEQLQRIETILQAGSAQRLSRPLRSRLATHAAIFAEELGDESRFARLVAEAVRLDPANPDAAEFAYTLARRNRAEPETIGTTLVNYVKAAPAGPHPRLQLSRWLTEQAAYERAAEQFNTALTLAAAPLPHEAYAYWVMALANSGDVRSALQLLDDVAPLSDEPRARNRRPRGLPIDINEFPDIRLGLEVLRLAISEDDADQAAKSFAHIRALVEQGMAEAAGQNIELLDDNGQGKTADRQGKQLLAWVSAVFNQQLDEVPNWLEGHPEDDMLVRRARGWMHLHRGERAEAAEQLRPIADTDAIAAVGLALMAGDAGSRQQTDALHRIIQRNGHGIPSMLAARRLHEAGEAPRRSGAANTIVAQMAQAPAHLWRPALNVSPWVTPHLSVTPARVGYLEPLHAVIELRNTSRMPLPVGTSQGVPGRMLLTLNPSFGGQPLPRPAPVVVDVGRRITLQPGEVLRVNTRLDRAELGAMMSQAVAHTLSLNVLGVLGPRVNASGGIVAEPVGGIEYVRAITIQGTPVTEDRLDEWTSQFDSSDDPVQRMRAAARLLRSLSQLPEQLDTQATHQRIADTINRRYADLSTTEQAWVVRFLPRDEEKRDMFRRTFEAAERSNTRLIRLIYMAVHLDGSDSPAMNAALRHEDTTIRAFARALREASQAPDASEADEEAPTLQNMQQMEGEQTGDEFDLIEPPALPTRP